MALLSGAASQHPPSITHTERDHHALPPQLVELYKRFKLSNDDTDKEVTDKHILKIYPHLGALETSSCSFGPFT